MRAAILSLISIGILAGCQSAPSVAPPPVPIAIDDQRSREQLHAVLWVQAAPEYRAASQQIYRAATAQLPSLLAAGGTALEDSQTSSFVGKPPAIIMDLDETVLDNSAYNAMLVRQHQPYTAANWLTWVMARQATAVPGAVQFITAARALGYQVLFVSNRACAGRTAYDTNGEAVDCPQQAATLANLRTLLGYEPTAEQLLLRSEQAAWRRSDKSLRRQALAAQYRIVMLVGDNLEDFINIAAYDPAKHAGHWGVDWFMLPNPMYGSWTDRAGKEMTVQEKCAALTAWNPGDADTAACYLAP